MAFHPGAKVIWLSHDTNPHKITIMEGEVISSKKDECKLKGWSDPFYSAFLYPDTPECRAFLLDGVQLKIRHYDEDNARMSKVFEFNNDLVRRGLK